VRKGSSASGQISRRLAVRHRSMNNPGGTVVASELGVFAITRTAGGDFTKTRVGAGATGGKPADCGAGEIRAGKLADGRRFLATVEPMHGTQAVAYLPGSLGNCGKASCWMTR